MSNRADQGEDRPSWREAGAGASRSSGAQPGSWRRTSGPKGPGLTDALRAPRSRRIFKALATACSLVCSGALIFLLWVMPGCTRTEMIISAVDNCQDCRVIAPVFAKHDGATLDQLRSSLNGTVTLAQTGGDFASRLQELNPKSVVVIYVAAQGGYFANGGNSREQAAGLFWKDTLIDEPRNKPTDRRQFYPLTQLREELRKLPQKQPKLLLLDVGSTAPQWRTGSLGNWFVDQIAGQVQGIANLTVICSALPGEMSWGGGHIGFDPQGRSAFAQSIATGLQGEADADRNRRITFPELFDYVQANTNAWVWQNREPAGQHPFSIPAKIKPDNSVYIALSSRAAGKKKVDDSIGKSAEKTSRKPAAGLKTVWTDLDAAWKAREQLRGTPQDVFRADAAYQFDPIGWRALTHDLLAAERFRRDLAAEQAEPLVTRAKLVIEQLRVSIQSDVLNKVEKQPVLNDLVVKRMRGLPAAAAQKNDLRLPEEHFAAACQDLIKTAARYAPVAKRGAELRRLAEQAACGPLGTRQIAEKLIKEGDKHRRSAEDRLFIEGDVDQISESQANAERTYQHARNLQQTYFQMYCLRNRLLAELPELAIWAAFRAPRVNASHRAAIVHLWQSSLADAPDHPPSVEQLRVLTESSTGLDTTNVEILMLYQLNRDFEKRLKDWSLAESVSETALKETQAQFAEAGRILKSIEERFSKRAELLSRAIKQPQVPNWRDLDELLAYPELASAARSTLNGLLNAYSEKLESEVKSGKGDKAPAPPTVDSRPAHARWHGLWAILTLSRGLDGLTDEQELWEQWSKLPADDSLEFTRKITDLGDRIRRAYIVNRDRLTEVALRGEQPAAEKLSLETLLSQQAAADRSARNYVDACTAAEFSGKLNPAAELRKFQMGFLLLSLADQYLDDFWKDWFDKAVGACLEGVKILNVAAFEPRGTELQAALKQRLSSFPDIRGETLVFGSSNVKDLLLEVTNRGLPAGEAAFWLEVPEGQGLTYDSLRRSINLFNPSADKSETFKFRLERDGVTRPKLELIEATPRVFYRGHDWKDDIKAIRINPLPPQSIQYAYAAPPPVGKVVVEGAQKPKFLFIMDCSLSMNELVTGTKVSRFESAKIAFDKTLGRLVNLAGNNACDVGLLAYGGGIVGVKALSPIRPLSEPLKMQLTKSYADLVPAGSTPLFPAIEQACDQLVSQQTAGTIIAITDGLDNVIDPDDSLFNRLKSKLERATGVELIIIGFEIKEEDRKKPDELKKYTQMKSLTENFYDVQGQIGLDTELRKAVSVRRYSIYPAEFRNGRSNPVASDIEFGEDRELPPGMYEARHGKGKGLQFQIAGGEFIKLQAERNRVLHPKPTNIRGLNPNPADPAEVQLGYQSFKIDVDKSIATFELSLVNADEGVSVPRPAEIDFDANPANDSGLRSTQWTILANQTVPTWRISVETWPGNQGAEIQAVWKMQRTPSDTAFRWRELNSAREFSVDALNNEQLKFKVQAVAFNSETRVARLEVTLASFDPKNPPAAGSAVLEELRKLRVELQPRGVEAPPTCSIKRDFIAEEGKLIVDIDLTGIRNLDEKLLNDWNVLLTSRKSLRSGAKVLKPAMSIAKTDQEL